MQDHNEIPEIPINEALELFLAVAYPHGIPEDVDKEKLIETLKAKIAQDRPEWAAKNTETKKNTPPPSPTGNYKEIKEAIISNSNESEVPDDPEERYLYERKQKALKNLAARKAEEEENTNREGLRKKIIEKNRDEAVDEDFLNKTLKIKEELQKKLALLQTPVTLDPAKPKKAKPGFSETESIPPGVSFSEDDSKTPNFSNSEFLNELPFNQESEPKANKVDFVKSIENMDRDEQIKAMVDYNKSLRANMQTKESLLRGDPKKDDRFSMEIGQKNETEKPDKEKEFLNYLIEKRGRKPDGMVNELKSVKTNEAKMSFSTTIDDEGKPFDFSEHIQNIAREKEVGKSADDMSMEPAKKREGQLNVDYSIQSDKLILE